jgi:hypothetical protein
MTKIILHRPEVRVADGQVEWDAEFIRYSEVTGQMWKGVVRRENYKWTIVWEKIKQEFNDANL